MLGGLYKGNVSDKMLSFFASASIFIIVFYLPIVSKHRSAAPLSGGIMEKKIVYLKTLQFVLTLIIIWQILSLRQFCGTFADPKTFFCDIRAGNCERYTLIGKDAETGEFSYKWHNQFIMNSSANAPQHQYFNFLIEKLPPAGRQCIPIMITPFDKIFDWIFKWTGMLNRNPLNNDTLFYFSDLFFNAFWSLGAQCIVIMEMLRSVEEYYSSGILLAFVSVISWYFSAAASFNLLFYWTDFWNCFNFRADRTIVPFDTLVVSIVMVCLYVFELFYRVRNLATYVIEEDDE